MKLRPHRIHSVGREDRGYEFWCQGCGKTHYVATWASSRSHGSKYVHGFNQDIDHPTFDGSIITLASPQGEWIDDGMGDRIWIHTTRQVPYCVVRITNGMLQYAKHSAHYLAGQSVYMHDIPTTRETRVDLVNMSKQRNDQHQRSPTRAMLVCGVGLLLTT